MIDIERRVTMTIKDYMNDHKEDLDLFTSALTKVHVDAHPEVKDVRDLYLKIQYKLDVDIKILILNLKLSKELQTIMRFQMMFAVLMKKHITC